MNPTRVCAAAGLILVAACAGGRPYSRDVARAFADDLATVRMRSPAQGNLSVGCVEPAEDAMSGTLRTGRAFLERHSPDSTSGRYVRALLACAHLARGEVEQAQVIVQGIPHPMQHRLSYPNAFVQAALHAVSACRSIEGRMALEEFFEGRLSARRFLEQYDTRVGIDLPPMSAEDHERELQTNARDLERRCIPRLAGDPRALERVDASRVLLRQKLAEQIYNDAAALLGSIPQSESRFVPAEVAWLIALTASVFVVEGLNHGDVLPAPLDPQQKQWQLEQISSAFAHVKLEMGRLLDEETRKEIEASGAPADVEDLQASYRMLYARLLQMEQQVVGWIATR